MYSGGQIVRNPPTRLILGFESTIISMEVLLRGRSRVAPTALPPLSCASWTIRVRHITDAEAFENVPVAIALSTELQAAQPWSELVLDLGTHWPVHSLTRRAESPIDTIDRQIGGL